MKKVLVWDTEKDAVVLEKLEDVVSGAKDFTLDDYSVDVSWASSRFDSAFTPEARLQVFMDVLDNRLMILRNTLNDLELLKVKMLIAQKELSVKDSKDEAPF